MKKRLPLIILSLLVIMAGLCGCAPSSQDTPLLWKVCDNDSYVYLFGSIHVATKDLYPLSNTIMDAYHSCDHLALEVSPDEMQTPEAMAAMAEYMRYDDGTLVTDVIGQDLFNEIVTILKSEFPNLQEDALLSYRPMMLQILLQTVIIGKTDLSEEYGIDTNFYNTALKARKPILSLEPYDMQLEIFKGFSQTENIHMLKTLLDIEKQAEATAQSYAAWRKGDQSALIEYETTPASADSTDYNIYLELGIKRNLHMADVIDGYLKDNKKVFVIAGAAHMIGNEGIASLLENNGYTVELISGQAIS